MKNVTLAVEEEILEAVRQYAASRGTTVNALVRDHLKRIAMQENQAAKARAELIKLSERSEGRLGSDYTGNREELYEDRLLPRHQRSRLRGFGEGDRGKKTKKSE